MFEKLVGNSRIRTGNANIDEKFKIGYLEPL